MGGGSIAGALILTATMLYNDDSVWEGALTWINDLVGLPQPVDEHAVRRPRSPARQELTQLDA